MEVFRFLRLQINRLDDLSPFRVNLVKGVSLVKSKFLADSVNKFFSSLNSNTEFNGSKFQLFHDIFQSSVNSLGLSGEGVSSMCLISNLELLQPFGSESIQSRGDDSRDRLGKRIDKVGFLDKVVEHTHLSDFNLIQGLQGREDKFVEFIILFKPGGGSQLLEFSSRGIHVEHHGQSSNSDISVLSGVVGDGRVNGKKDVSVMLRHTAQRVDGHSLFRRRRFFRSSLNDGDKGGDDRHILLPIYSAITNNPTG